MRSEHYTNTLNLGQMMGALQGFLNEELMGIIKGVHAHRDVSKEFCAILPFRT